MVEQFKHIATDLDILYSV